MENQEVTPNYKQNIRYAAYATITSRIIALVVDAVAIMIVVAGIIFFTEYFFEGELALIPTTLCVIFAYLYFPLMEGKYGATLGKMAMGIEVVGKGYEKIGYTKAFLRNSFRFLIICLTLLIPPHGSVLNPAYLSAIAFVVNTLDFFASINSLYYQMLHDLIADTYVVDAIGFREKHQQ